MSNPVLQERWAEKFDRAENSFEVTSVSGTALKTLFLLALLSCTSYVTFGLTLANSDKAAMLSGAGFIVTLFITFGILFVKNIKLMAPLSIVFALAEGLLVGAISGMFTVAYGTSIIVHAVIATFAALFAVLFLYSAKIIKCTDKFRGVLMGATLAILVIYLVQIIMSFVKPDATSILMGKGLIGIGFSLIVCAIAALNFIIDFDFIERAKNAGLSKDFEWYGAFGLLVTLVWLYIEILRLLAKLDRR